MSKSAARRRTGAVACADRHRPGAGRVLRLHRQPLPRHLRSHDRDPDGAAREPDLDLVALGGDGGVLHVGDQHAVRRPWCPSGASSAGCRRSPSRPRGAGAAAHPLSSVAVTTADGRRARRTGAGCGTRRRSACSRVLPRGVVEDVPSEGREPGGRREPEVPLAVEPAGDGASGQRGVVVDRCSTWKMSSIVRSQL